MEVNIKDYLSEEEMRDIAISEYKAIVRKGLTEDMQPKRMINNYERVVANAVHYYLESEVDKIIGTDIKKQIESTVKRVLNKSLEYNIFRRKDHWEKEDSPATKHMDKCIRENLKIIEDKVKDKLSDLPETYFEGTVQDLVYTVIQDRLIGKDKTVDEELFLR